MVFTCCCRVAIIARSCSSWDGGGMGAGDASPWYCCCCCRDIAYGDGDENSYSNAVLDIS